MKLLDERVVQMQMNQLKLRVAQATEVGDCTKPLLPRAKCSCNKCAAEHKQKWSKALVSSADEYG